MKCSFRHIFLAACCTLLWACEDDIVSGPATSPDINFAVPATYATEGASSRTSQLTAMTRMVATSADGDSLWLSVTATPTGDISTAATRGTPLDEATITDFGVSCLRTTEGSTKLYFHSEKYTGTVASDSWVNANGKTYYWMPKDANFDFFAWTPFNAPVFSDPARGIFRYTVPADVRSQRDLCGCYIQDATPGIKVPLKFSHLLSRIKFNVPERDNLALGTVTNIEISNLCRSGSYSLISGEWTLNPTDLFTFKVKPETAYTSGIELTANGLELFMLPQAIADGSVVTITFKPENGAIKTFTKPLKGITWLKGYTYTFNVGITEEGAFEFANDTPVQDANYVSHTNIIHPVSVGASQNWTAKVRASDGADISIIKEADVNIMATEGFWTDRILDKNGNDKGSARGTDRISSSGSTDVPVRIFLPENVSDQNRIIYVDFYFDNASEPVTTLTLLQYCPDWVGDYGWEQIDDNGIGNFGFNWTRNVYLTYKYNIPRIGTQNNANYKYLMTVWESYGKPWWTSTGSFTSPTNIFRDRWYIRLDYSLLTDLTGSTSRSDGHGNTVWLNQYGGEAATMAMENGILSIHKTQANHTHETAFRIATPEDDGRDAPISTLTSPKLASDIALSHALMKNPYNIRETEVNEEGQMGYIPVIREIKWYLPAVDQFSILPKLEPINPGEYWSSTIEPGTDTEPFDGAGVKNPRGTWLKIRACRNR